MIARKRVIPFLALCLGAVSLAYAQSGFRVPWWAVDGGGGVSRGGFWSAGAEGNGVDHNAYLPLVVRARCGAAPVAREGSAKHALPFWPSPDLHHTLPAVDEHPGAAGR